MGVGWARARPALARVQTGGIPARAVCYEPNDT